YLTFCNANSQKMAFARSYGPDKFAGAVANFGTLGCGQTPLRALVRALRRFSARRSSSLIPPHTPASWPESNAQVRQSVVTGQRLHTSFASAIWARAGPLFPTGKNSSGSSSRQTALWRQSMDLI